MASSVTSVTSVTCVTSTAPAKRPDSPAAEYVWHLPMKETPVLAHFSTLLLSGSVFDTLLELALLTSVSMCAAFLPAEIVNVPGSVPLKQLGAWMWLQVVFRRVYNAFLEAVFFSFPQYRTQPAKEHALQKKTDLCGRDQQQLDTLVMHDRLTMLSQFALQLMIYYTIPGYFPAAAAEPQSLAERIVRLVAYHYVMSFGMYWMHRACHVVPFLWDNIHSIHHWATHPLSRNTYQDHWVDNLLNEIVGAFSAQIIVPLDRETFVASHLLRIMESLEKHSGTSCWMNLAHQAQSFLPFSNMPYHHDWHHEGHKASNFTFSALGGLWDCVFGTRKAGRGLKTPQATSHDLSEAEKKRYVKANRWERPMLSLVPVAALLSAVAYKLATGQFTQL